MSIAIGAVAAASLGLFTVSILSRDERLEVRNLAKSASADMEQVPPAVTEGDPRITWTSLPTSLSSPLVADGESVWLGVTERLGDDGRFESAAYRYAPRSGGLERVAVFRGRATAAAVVDGGVALGVGNSVVLVESTGATQIVSLPQRPGLGPDMRTYVTALAHVSGRLFAAVAGSNQVDEVDVASGSLIRTIDLGPDVAPPATLVALDQKTLLASTPFGKVGGAGPGTLAIDLPTGRVARVDVGRPFSFSRTPSGRLVASQAVPGGGLTELRLASDGSVHAEGESSSSIPWNGRWDLVAATDSSIWGAVQGDKYIYRQRPDGTLDRFELPTVPFVPSVPPGAKISPEMERVFLAGASRTVSSMATLSDGSLVFLSDSPGGVLGFIPAN